MNYDEALNYVMERYPDHPEMWPDYLKGHENTRVNSGLVITQFLTHDCILLTTSNNRMIQLTGNEQKDLVDWLKRNKPGLMK